MHITIATNHEDWAAVYFDGKKVDSGHEICWEDVLALLGYTVSRLEVDPAEEAAGFPDVLPLPVSRCPESRVDRLNGGCPFCGKGVFSETSIDDDRDGVLHCSSCKLQIQRYS